MLRHPSLLLLLAAVALVVGCAPQTAFRRSALVRAPTGDTLITPVEGRAQLAGQVTHGTTDRELVPAVGDPALHVARTQLRGHARFKLGDYVTIGGEAHWSHLELSEASATGVPPVTREHVWGMGPIVSVHFGPSKSNVSFGVAAALSLESVPWATWERTTPASFGDWGFDERQHRLSEDGTDLLVLMRVSGGMSYRFFDALSMHTGVSFQNHVVNIGYDDQARDGSTATASDVGVVPFVGIKARIPEEGLYALAQWYMPLGYEQLNGPQMGGLIQLGADLE